MRFKPKIAVITGGTAGVGRATAVEFARRKIDVAVIARAGLDETAQELKQAGVRVLACRADVADFEQVEACADRVERELGPIDIWVNNAMATIFSPFKDIAPKEFKRATEVTYLGAVWGTMTALKRMMPRDRGVIVQVGSALAYRAIPLQAPYCGAKHAVKGFTDSIRSELMHDGSKVRITMVQLPALNTPQFEWGLSRMPRHPQPVPPIFQPEMAARAIFWAATHRNRELFVGWPAVKAIEANKFFPGYLDRYLARHAYDGQQTDEPLPEKRQDNLFEPVPEKHRTHGRFDARSRPGSLYFRLSKHRFVVIAGSLALSAVILSLLH